MLMQERENVKARAFNSFSRDVFVRQVGMEAYFSANRREGGGSAIETMLVATSGGFAR